MDSLSLDNLAKVIDNAMDSGDVASIHESLNTLNKLSSHNLDAVELAKIAFFKANCYATLRQLKKQPSCMGLG